MSYKIKNIFFEEEQKTSSVINEDVLSMIGSALGQAAKVKLKNYAAKAVGGVHKPVFSYLEKLKKMGVTKIGKYNVDDLISGMEKELGVRKSASGEYVSASQPEEADKLPRQRRMRDRPGAARLGWRRRRARRRNESKYSLEEVFTEEGPEESTDEPPIFDPWNLATVKIN